jgi:hypothetical protein
MKMVAARPYKGVRPKTQRGADTGYTRSNYADWVRRFRARWSDRTLVIRPQTYRLLFKKAIGMKEPQPIAPARGVKEAIGAKEEETATEETTHAATP